MWLPWGARGRGGIDGEFGISRRKLVYIGWMNNRPYFIAQGTISSILQQTMTEKNMQMNVDIYITELLYCIAKVNTTL